eukprot:6185971-Pleurochrysis_carterae.AAC.1
MYDDAALRFGGESRGELRIHEAVGDDKYDAVFRMEGSRTTLWEAFEGEMENADRIAKQEERHDFARNKKENGTCVFKLCYHRLIRFQPATNCTNAPYSSLCNT